MKTSSSPPWTIRATARPRRCGPRREAPHMPRSIKQTVTIQATPQEIYEALMDSRRHAKFTGGSARISRKVGGRFSVFDGYASGKNLKLVAGRKIVQTWRADDWPEGHYSTVNFALAKTGRGTRLMFTQTNVPGKYVRSVRKGWTDFYWKPLKAMLARSRRVLRQAR